MIVSITSVAGRCDLNDYFLKVGGGGHMVLPFFVVVVF